MKPNINEALSCCGKILDILKKEQKEIDEEHLDNVEHYCSLKMELIKDLDRINSELARESPSERSAEVEHLLKKIIDLNDTNAEAVKNMKRSIIGEVSDSHKQKKAVKAYNP